MKISVICPVRNGKTYLKQALDSVISQEGSFDTELIIIDGASSDGTKEILQEYENKYKSGELCFKCDSFSLLIISEPDQGMYDALSKGFRLCTGDVICWINADDYYLEGAFSKACKVFSDLSEVNWITGRANSEKDGRYIWKSMLRYFPCSYIRSGLFGLYSDHFIAQENTFWKKECLKYIDYNKLSEFKLAGDFYLWNEFSKEEHLYSCDEDFAVFRVHNNNMSGNTETYRQEMRSIVKGKPSAYQKLWIRYMDRKWHLGKKDFEHIEYMKESNIYRVVCK